MDDLNKGNAIILKLYFITICDKRIAIGVRQMEKGKFTYTMNTWEFKSLKPDFGKQDRTSIQK
ncbi:hypothetical protein D3C78_1513490 [compost metagenome]